MSHLDPPRDDFPEYVRIPELMRRGVPLSRSLLYDLVRRGELPCVRIGRTRLIPLAAVREYLDRHLTPKKEEK